MSLRLHPGERVLYEGHPSWRAMIAYHLKVLAVAVLAGFLVRLILGGALEIFLVVLGALVIGVAFGWTRRQATSYTVTDRRLNIRRGLLSREIQETRLDRIQNVGYRQRPLQRALRIGDIDFDTASSTDGYSLVFAGVSDPASIVHQIDAEAPVDLDAG